MAVYLKNATRKGGLDPRKLRATAQSLLEALEEGESSLSLSFVGDEAIRELNRAYRGIDKPTDVLSFSLVEDSAALDESERLLGDIVISLDTARRQAAEYDATLDREVARLLIHGLLHLLGHDHHEPGERATMEREERRLARAIGLEWPY
jgi:probable rRNA maturation factor